jgi:hypothetical protein
MPPSTTFPQPFYCYIQGHCFSNALLYHAMQRWSSMKKRWFWGKAAVVCAAIRLETPQSHVFGPLRPTTGAHVAIVPLPIKVYTRFKRLSRTSPTKLGFNPRAFINISVCIIRIHHCSTSPPGPESTPWVSLTLRRSSAQLVKLEVPSTCTQTFTSYLTANTLHLHYKAKRYMVSVEVMAV